MLIDVQQLIHVPQERNKTPQEKFDKIINHFLNTQQNEENRCLLEETINGYLIELKHKYYITSKNLDYELLSGPSPKVTVNYDFWNIGLIEPNRFAKFLLEYFKINIQCQ